jgi:hypothetical protein
MNIDEYIKIFKTKRSNNETEEIVNHFKSDKMLDAVVINDSITIVKKDKKDEGSYRIYDCNINYDFVTNIESNIPISILVNDLEFKVDNTLTLPIISMKNQKIQFKIYNKHLCNISAVNIKFDCYIFSNLVRKEFDYYNKLAIQTNYGMEFLNGFIKL